MCGFTGHVSFKEIDKHVLKHANKHSHCRGPDSKNNLAENGNLNINLWFNRLAIIDLSKKANQPMVSKNNDSILMFNGEIYNANILREKLLKDGCVFDTNNSDTEALLNGLDKYGTDFISKLEGQFSFFYINKNRKKIIISRDRVGQKPFYYKFNNEELIFSSNLKSILEIVNDKEVDKSSLEQYISYGIIFSPRTLFKNIYKLPPATFFEFEYSDEITLKKDHLYWEPDQKLASTKFDQKEFENIFSNSVKKRMISDVPIASFLSGGIDSSSIVKMQKELGYKTKTFSVVIDNKKINEKKYIEEVVNRFKTDHEQITIDEKISDEIIQKAILCLDEPFSDPSVVPSYYLSNLISKNFKVAISGDGGDELLGGYQRIKNYLRKRSFFELLISKIYKIYPSYLGSGTKLRSKSDDYFDAYLGYLEDEKLYNLIFKNKLNSEIKIKPQLSASEYKTLIKTDYRYYLSEQMMFKVDRTSMANSLEVRSPFVDHELIEYIFSHENSYFDGKAQKLPLRKYLLSDFSKNFLDRPKQGFVFDYKNWVYSNIDNIFGVIDNSILNEYVNVSKIKILKYFRTRFNSLRIWKVYVLAIYLDSVKDR